VIVAEFFDIVEVIEKILLRVCILVAVGCDSDRNPISVVRFDDTRHPIATVLPEFAECPHAVIAVGDFVTAWGFKHTERFCWVIV
jgi:hypothetical protein